VLYGETRHAALSQGQPPPAEEGVQTTSATHRWTKRWGTRGFTARLP
jgi:hypothetical protein